MDLAGLTNDELVSLRQQISVEVNRRQRVQSWERELNSLLVEKQRMDGLEQGAPWQQPTGAHDSYAKGAKVTHNDREWESLIVGNVWAPGVSGWREIVPITPDEPQYPTWVQPTMAEDAYPLLIADAPVIVWHNDNLWKNTTPANVWEPGVFGWELYTA